MFDIKRDANTPSILSTPTPPPYKTEVPFQIQNLKLITAKAESIIHTDITRLGVELMDFQSGAFLEKYHSEILGRGSNNGKKVKLPKPFVLEKGGGGSGEDSTTTSSQVVESFRYSSNRKEVYRVVQRSFVDSDGEVSSSVAKGENK